MSFCAVIAISSSSSNPASETIALPSTSNHMSAEELHKLLLRTDEIGVEMVCWTQVANPTEVAEVEGYVLWCIINI